MDIQSLIFPKDKYTRETAKRWANISDYKCKIVKETDTHFIIVQDDAENFKNLKTVELREDVSASTGTLSTDIATPDIPLYKRDENGKICPDCTHMGKPCFDVDSKDYFRASTYRDKGARYKIDNEKVKAFMKESGYRTPFLIKYENNYLQVK